MSCPLKLSVNPVGFNTFLANLTVEIRGFQGYRWFTEIQGFSCLRWKDGQAQLAEVLCAAHLRLGAPEVRKVERSVVDGC